MEQNEGDNAEACITEKEARSGRLWTVGKRHGSILIPF